MMAIFDQKKSQAECFAWNLEGTVHAHLPISIGAWWIKKFTDVSQIVRNGSGSLKWWGARRRGQSTVRKYFINSTDTVAAATTPSCTIEVTRNQINVTERFIRARTAWMIFLAIPLFLAKTLLMCNGKTVKAVWPLDAARRKESRDTKPCKTHPCSPSTK